MARRVVRTVTTKKPRVARKQKKSYKKTRVPRSMPLTGFAASKRVKLCANFQIASNNAIGAATTDVIYFFGNAMNNATGGWTAINWPAPTPGLGAAGFTSWANIYSKYSVLATKVTDNVISLSAVPGSICKVALIPTRGISSGVTTISDTLENKWGIAKYISVNNSGRNITRLTKYMSAHKVLGVTQAQYADDDYTAATGNGAVTPSAPGSSTDMFTWNVVTKNCSGNSIPSGTFALDIKVTYYIKFTNCGLLVG